MLQEPTILGARRELGEEQDGIDHKGIWQDYAALGD